MHCRSSRLVSPLKAPYVTAKHGLLGLAKVVALEGAPHRVAANVVCPGYVRTPLVDRQIPEQAKDLGIPGAQVVREVMLGGTVEGEFTTTNDIAEAAAFPATFPSLALTGQSVVASHGLFMEQAAARRPRAARVLSLSPLRRGASCRGS